MFSSFTQRFAFSRVALGRFALDRVALGLSALCLVHCLASVFLVAAIAGGSHFLEHPAWHQIGLALAILFAALGLGTGYRRHRHTPPVAIGVLGLAVMGSALIVPHGAGEAILTVIGVALVGVAHVMNIRGQRRAR